MGMAIHTGQVVKKRKVLYIVLGILYGLDLANLQVFTCFKAATSHQVAQLEPSTAMFWQLFAMLAGGVIWSWMAFRRYFTLPGLLRFTTGGQGLFMVGIGILLYTDQSSEILFYLFRALWGFFFAGGLGISLPIIIERFPRREWTGVFTKAGCVGLLTATFFLGLYIGITGTEAVPASAAFSWLPTGWLTGLFSQNYLTPVWMPYTGAGLSGLLFCLFWRFIPFDVPVRTFREMPRAPGRFWAPFTRDELFSPRALRVVLPLIGIGLTTYYFAFYLMPALEDFGYFPKRPSGDDEALNKQWEMEKEAVLQTSIFVRYFFTAAGFAIAGWWSKKWRKRSPVIAWFFGFQFIAIVIFICLPQWAGFRANLLLLFLAAAVAGISAGNWIIGILLIAESFGNRWRPAVAILIPNLHRGLGAFAVWGLGAPGMEPAHVAFGFGLILVAVGIASALALDDSNFEGNADFGQFDQYNSYPEPLLNAGVQQAIGAITPEDWRDHGRARQTLERLNAILFQRLCDIFGDYIYNCGMYRYDRLKRLDSPGLKFNSPAFEGLPASCSDFEVFLKNTRPLTGDGWMASLVQQGFGKPQLRGIFIHNGAISDAKYDADIAAFDLDKIRIMAPGTEKAFTYLVETSDAAEMKARLDAFEETAEFDLETLNNFKRRLDWNGDDRPLRRALIVRKVEAAPIPKGEYLLWVLFPENQNDADAVIAFALLAAHAKVQEKLLEIEAVLAYMLLQKKNTEIAQLAREAAWKEAVRASNHSLKHAFNLLKYKIGVIRDNCADEPAANAAKADADLWVDEMDQRNEFIMNLMRAKDLAATSPTDASHRFFQTSPCNLKSVLQDCLDMLEKTLDDRRFSTPGHTENLRRKCLPALKEKTNWKQLDCSVVVVGPGLRIALQDLLENALQNSDPGDPRVEIFFDDSSTDTPKLRIQNNGLMLRSDLDYINCNEPPVVSGGRLGLWTMINIFSFPRFNHAQTGWKLSAASGRDAAGKPLTTLTLHIPNTDFQ